jgi:hypothetical protein
MTGAFLIFSVGHHCDGSGGFAMTWLIPGFVSSRLIAAQSRLHRAQKTTTA